MKEKKIVERGRQKVLCLGGWLVVEGIEFNFLYWLL